MKDYYYIAGMYRGNEVTAIDTDGKERNIEKMDHSSKMVFESEKDAEKFINRLDPPTDPNFRYQVETWDPGTLFLIDSWNNHKVIREFDTEDEAREYIETRVNNDNWYQMVDTAEDYADGFYLVEWSDMREAVRKYGKRKLQYWT